MSLRTSTKHSQLTMGIGRVSQPLLKTAIRRNSPNRPSWLSLLLLLLPIAIIASYRYLSRGTSDHVVEEHGESKVLVSYSYFEKDPIQRDNFDYFITMGMGVESRLLPALHNVDFTVVISGDKCSPCSRLLPMLKIEEMNPLPHDVSAAHGGPHLTLLQRIENEGMDFAAHNITLEWTKAKGTLRTYKFFIFLNSSVKGPFLPTYMPPHWQWPMAYTQKLIGDVKAVSSSIVCLPEVDAGGPGAKIESWAYGVDIVGLDILMNEGVFELHLCKTCPDGIVVKGEYGLTTALMKHGYTIDTLMSKYRGIDWRDQRHWKCNNNVHPSRHGTYDGISMHPFETMFLKASWHVGEPYVDKYTEWMMAQARGEDTTQGEFDEPMYRYAITMQAQESHHVERCYQVLDRTTS